MLFKYKKMPLNTSRTFYSTSLPRLLLCFVYLFVGGSASTYQESIPRCPTPLNSFPCLCSKTSLEAPLDVLCRSGNVASISLALRVNYAKETPLRNVSIEAANITHLMGSLFQGLTSVSSLAVEASSVESLSFQVLNPLAPSLRFLSLKSNKLSLMPTDSLLNLNLTHIDVSNNSIAMLSSLSIPKSLSSLLHLNLSYNKVSKIESSSLYSVINSLEELDVSHNQVSKLERNTFKGGKKIRLLDLSYNSLGSLDRSDFVELLGLQVIRLAGQSDRKLNKLPQSIFARNAQLHTIDVSNNAFTEVDAYTTRGVRFLRKYIASGNAITSIARRAFSTNNRIRVIDLSRNLLDSIPADTFMGLQYLETLDLSHNQIKSIDSGAFQSIYKIDIILSHNNISLIPRSAFTGCANISMLDLSYNNISRIHSEAFLDSDVTQLVLNHNKISNLTLLPIANLPGIRFLNLSYNEITRVDLKSFGLKQNTKLYEAAVIDLSFNKLTELSGSMFEKFWALRYLNLSNNHFIRLGFGSFGNLPTLLELNLDNNRLKDIGSINGLISLKTLTARNNSLKSVPIVSVALNEMHLDDNKIDSVSCSSFPMLNSLLSLHLRNNSIANLDSDSFCNLLTLRNLDLSLNNISHVEQVSTALQKLSSLQSLDLSFNSIPSVESNCFGNLPTLFILNLAGNSISQVSPFAFNGLLQLLSLNLSSNLMSSIEHDSLKGLVSLQTLDLSFNSLSRIENRTNSVFEDLLSLESLFLAGNRLSFLTPKSMPSSPWIPYKIRLLDLSHNHIESVSTAYGFAQIQELFLHHNHIRTLVPGVFGNMSSLRSLDLSHNRITQIPLHAFSGNVSSKDHFIPSLELINLSHNRIDSIEAGELTRLSVKTNTSLSSLDLSHNKLSTFWPEVDVSILVGRGVSVSLKKNPLSCSCGSRLKVDTVRRSIQRISPRLSNMLTFNHDVNTYNKEDNALFNTILNSKTDIIMNEARNEWESLTCPFETLASKKRSRNHKPRGESLPSNDSGNTTSLMSTPLKDSLLITYLSGQDLSCSDRESLALLEGDVLIRGASWLRGRKPSIRVVWFVRNEADDVAAVRIERSQVDPDQSESLEVDYSDREFTFPDLDPRKSHRICIRSFDSLGRARPVYPSSCVVVEPKPR